MASSAQRPVNLNLMKFRLPIAGIMSIMHRVSGLFIALLLPVILYWADTALNSAEGFAAISQSLQGFLGTAVLFILLWALMHHLLAGIRYLLLDIDIGIEKPFYRQTAWAVIIAAPVFSALLTGGLS